ncbi:MAG: alginate export family protein [Gammaproteobacteria bacterium]|nr:alginate export family protein [Gammaproteobacteria bacterium]
MERSVRKLLPVLLTVGIHHSVPAADSGPLDYGFQFSMDRSALDGLKLGDDPTGDRLVEADLEFEFSLEYLVNENLYLFLTGALIDETVTLETAGNKDAKSGLERKQVGIGYFFGEQIKAELNLGRMEFVSASEWWLWWDEELDAIRLESTYGDFEAMLALAEEQARTSTGDDFIDPEFDAVRRVILSLGWEVAANHNLVFYYLDQSDNSGSLDVGDFEHFDRIDDEDADLAWSGISYLGEFDIESVGELEIELHTARVSGDETVYVFDDPAGGLSEVIERKRNSVRGMAQSYLLSWTPSALDDWTLIVGGATGSGDSDPDDGRVRSFRQSGLQGDSESFGELYQPELSNLVVDLIGIEWEMSAGVEIALLRYDYEQRKLADEMRDVSIDLDLTGASRDLGREIDLILTIESRRGLDLVLTAAEFDPGNAYGGFAGTTSNFISIELVYEF